MLFASCLSGLAVCVLGCSLGRPVHNLLANHRNDPLAVAKVWELGLSGFIQETILTLLSDTENSLSSFLTHLIHLKQQAVSDAF